MIIFENLCLSLLRFLIYGYGVFIKIIVFIRDLVIFVFFVNVCLYFFRMYCSVKLIFFEKFLIVRLLIWFGKKYVFFWFVKFVMSVMWLNFLDFLRFLGVFGRKLLFMIGFYILVVLIKSLFVFFEWRYFMIFLFLCMGYFIVFVKFFVCFIVKVFNLVV